MTEDHAQRSRREQDQREYLQDSASRPPAAYYASGETSWYSQQRWSGNTYGEILLGRLSTVSDKKWRITHDAIVVPRLTLNASKTRIRRNSKICSSKSAYFRLVSGGHRLTIASAVARRIETPEENTKVRLTFRHTEKRRSDGHWVVKGHEEREGADNAVRDFRDELRDGEDDWRVPARGEMRIARAPW